MAVELYGWGANSHGQLGVDYQSEQTIQPERIDLSKININPIDIKCIVGGAGHTLILHNSGRLYGCGWNKKGQVGIFSSDSDTITSFQPIIGLNTERIVNVVCGWDSSLALTENGEIYGWGSNYYGQLGIKKLSNDNELLNSCDEYTYNPTKILIGVKVKQISMGLRHSAVITDDGRVFVAGSGNKCQLGLVNSYHKPILCIDTFTPVSGIDNIVNVACGQYFTMALASNGDIFIWGNNKYGQLGVDCNEIVSSIVPIKLENNFGGIKMIGAGWTHANVLNNDGIIFSWGRDDYGQLGNCLHDTYPKWRPRIVEFTSNISQLSVGSEHNVALNDDGKIYSWGWNEHGNCGNGNIENVFVPCKIFKRDNDSGLLIGSGAAHSFAIIKTELII